MVEAQLVTTNIMFIVAVSVIVGCFAYTMFELRTTRARLAHLERNNRRMVDEAHLNGFREGFDAASRANSTESDLS